MNMVREAHTLKRTQGRVVILGSGWAGFKLLKDLDKKGYETVVISPRNYFVFTPLLASTSVGTLEFRSILEPVRGYARDCELWQAYCDGIDLEKKELICTSNLNSTVRVPQHPLPLAGGGVAGTSSVPNPIPHEGSTFRVSYDKLVIAVGAYSNTFGIKGVKEYALFLKDIGDAQKIRKRVLECFCKAAQPGVTEQQQMELLHFAVVGGGPTGIEFSAELFDFISEDLSRLYPKLMDKVQMTVYDVAPTILGSFDKKLGDYAMKKFRRNGIQVKTGRHVTGVTATRLMIDGEGEVPYGMLVWATGLMQNPLIKSLDTLAKDAKGQRLLTDGQLRVLDKATAKPIPDVYALGDCATIQDYDLPATAQVANQKAGYLAKQLNKLAKYGPDYLTKLPQFTFKNLGAMAYIGKWEAVVDMTPVQKDLKEGGHFAWLFWRSSYLTMSVSLRNRLLIPMYWFLTWLVGRDITRF